jgi:hypothetical protein
MGVSMSVTAFPVLARIISERRMLRRPLGTLALSAAALDDVSAWPGIATRTVAVPSAKPGRDVVKLSRGAEIDLVLLDGRRPLLGEGVPREDVGTVLSEAPCDVAVVVAREGTHVAPGTDGLVMVPFGGAERDWAALELASWLCATTGARLELMGAAGRTEDGKDASHCSPTLRCWSGSSQAWLPRPFLPSLVERESSTPHRERICW